MTDPAIPSLLAFAAAALIIEITPGPNMAYLAALSLSRGWRSGLAAVGGIALGLSIIGIAASFGLAALIEESALFYEILRWAGVAYLFWLAWESWATQSEIAPEKSRDSHERSAFRRGLITNLLNPKAAIFYITVVPSFIVPAGSVVRQTLILIAIYVAIATIVHSVLVMLASRLHARLSDPARRQPVRRALALALAGIAVWFAFSTAR